MDSKQPNNTDSAPVTGSPGHDDEAPGYIAKAFEPIPEALLKETYPWCFNPLHHFTAFQQCCLLEYYLLEHHLAATPESLDFTFTKKTVEGRRSLTASFFGITEGHLAAITVHIRKCILFLRPASPTEEANETVLRWLREGQGAWGLMMREAFELAGEERTEFPGVESGERVELEKKAKLIVAAGERRWVLFKKVWQWEREAVKRANGELKKPPPRKGSAAVGK